MRLLPLVVLAACGAPELTELERNRALWEGLAIDDYAYTLRYGCFCPEETTAPARITVVDGAITAAVYADDAQGVTPGAPVAEGYEALTVEGLFDAADEALREADAATVTYDAVQGFPTWIDIDWIAQAIDDEQSLRAGDLVPGP